VKVTHTYVEPGTYDGRALGDGLQRPDLFGDEADHRPLAHRGGRPGRYAQQASAYPAEEVTRRRRIQQRSDGGMPAATAASSASRTWRVRRWAT
jgi:hypothetical protein